MFNTFWMTSRWAVMSLLFGVIIISTFIPNYYWNNELFHVLIEGGGSIIGFGLALIVLAMINKKQLPVTHVWLVASFISMGTLDIFHSQTHPGQVFVWLHSVATFIGGLFAMLIWLPESLSKKFFKPFYLWLLILMLIGFSFFSILMPNLIFTMLDVNKQFTSSANAFNIIGGIGFLMAWFYFAKEYHRHHHSRLFFFSNHFALFGIAGLLFEFSILWDGNWWFWHFMRSFAYILLAIHFSSIYRKNLLIKIEQSNQVFDQSLNEIYMFDKDTFLFTEVNLSAQKNIGYSMAELKNMSPFDIKPEIKKDDFIKIINPLLAGIKEKVVFQTVHQRKDESQYNAEIHLQLTNKEPTVFFAIIIDITERIRAEEFLRISQQRLLLHREQSPVGIIEWNTNFEFLYWNPAAEKIFGFTRDEVQGKHITECILPESARTTVDKVWEELIENNGGYYSLNENTTKDGRTILCEWHNTPLVDDDGNVIGVASIVDDITERKKMEMDLIESKNEAEEANRTKSLFLSSMSHEIRTPMNAVLGFAQLIKEDTKDEYIEDSALEIITAGKHLLELIEEMLDISTIESGKVKLCIESYELKNILNICISMINSSVEQRSITIDNKVDSLPDIKIKVDEKRFKQVILNFLTNAIKYNIEKGSVIIDCSVVDEKMLFLSVTDSGKGIAPHYYDNIFNHFDRAGQEGSNITGTGLGLAISKKLIEKMNGTIGFESTIGEGSCFWVKVPLS